MITVADAELLERETELATLRALVAAARDGCGGIALVEGASGQGKSTLLRALRADASGVRVLSAIGSEPERDLPFGVLGQLLPGLDGTDDSSLGRLRRVIEHAAGEPLLVVVDDVHWADSGSLEVLGMLARRVERLPIGLVLAMRSGEHDALLDALYAAPGAVVLDLAPLTPAAVGHLVGCAVAGSPDPAFVAAAAMTTGGNPLLVRELRRMLGDAGYTGTAEEAGAVRDAVPATVARLVQARLRSLPLSALALAYAVATFAEDTPASLVYRLSELDNPAEAHAVLARAGLMEPGALRLTYPMLRAAVRESLVPAARAELHRRAALLLRESDAGEELIAAQLLATDPGGDAEAAALLTRTGERALHAGDVEVAVQQLRRALAETGEAPPERLLALGLAEARTGDAAAGDHLRAAAARGGPVTAARAQQALARRLVLAGRPVEAADVLKDALARLGNADRALTAELEDDLLDGLVYEAHDERRDRLDAADDRPVVLAHRAFDGAGIGAPANEVIDLARRALADGSLFDGGMAVMFAIEALMAVEAADVSRTAIDAYADHARRAGSKVATLGALIARSRWEHAFGDLERALEAARAAIGLYGRTPTAAMRSVLAAALLDGGDVDGAEAALGGPPPDGAQLNLPICGFHALQGRILLERGRPGDALSAVERQIELERSRGWRITLREYTRATYVRALGDTGRLDEARAFAADQLAFTRARRMRAAEARMLLATARLALSRDEELARLEQAVAAAQRSPSAFVLAEALTAHGAALRRANRRAEARDPLRQAREKALAIGARGLEKLAHEELVIAGARPQRVASSGPEGLTPAERRVAELAAQGRRNREIAEELFVTLKTVEVHLGRAYTKLGINSRTQLAETLGAVSD